jgi:hypothetical protein
MVLSFNILLMGWCIKGFMYNIVFHIQWRDNMEIRTDLIRPSEAYSRAGASPAPVRQNPHIESAVNLQNVSSRRELVNAMSLMQTASGIVQEALNASSRLRSIAMSTIATGDTNYTEIAKTIAGIQSSLQQYGTPVISPPVNETGPVQHTLPDIGRELEAIGTMAQKKSVDPELLSSAEKKLMKAASDIDTRLASAQREFGAVPVQSPVTAQDISRSLTGNHQQALAAQGNIIQETAGTLLR